MTAPAEPLQVHWGIGLKAVGMAAGDELVVDGQRTSTSSEAAWSAHQGQG